MKICAYVQTQYAKQNYAKECLDTRQFVGLRVIIDCIEQTGRAVEYAGSATVHEYDSVLVSLTSDCDWWSFIAERVKWKPGKYKVIIGGAGLLNVRPFLEYADYFVLGRGENVIDGIIDEIETGNRFDFDSVIRASEFSADNKYMIAQASCLYPNEIEISGGKKWNESMIGCNHKCLFCGYTWHRKQLGQEVFAWDDAMGMNMKDKEKAMLDMCKDYSKVDFSHLRTTAIDGMSERLRFKISKKITRKHVVDFLIAAGKSKAKPHQLKLYNIIGYPTETEEDWIEFVETIKEADSQFQKSTQWSILLHCTPFRATPATPVACWPMEYRNMRGEVGRILGKGLKGNLVYQGKKFWAVESMGTESLPTVFMSAIAIRGTEDDARNIRLLACSKKYAGLDTKRKVATMENYFDREKLFGQFSTNTLPTRYLKTYAKYERAL